MTKNVIVKLSTIFAKKYYDSTEIHTVSLETYVQNNVEKYLNIAQKIGACEHNLLALQKRFNEQKQALREEQAEIWKLCDHPVRSYHPDPSGNNDSYYECEVCGKEL